jgi:GNAT superfamily N-acetyltransferase
MSLDPIEIRRAPRERVPVLASMLARAFAEDPMVQLPLEPDPDRERTRAYFQLLDEVWADLGFLWEAGDGAGAAAWVPPDGLSGLADVNERLSDAFRPLTSDAGARHDTLWDWVESKIPSEPLWFLDQVGVDPGRQGEGIGRALIGVGLERARADHVAAFLETGVQRNVAYYERLGFRLVEDEDSPSGGPHVWFMRFDP